ncbi:hypothetical protein [Celerinatantimonas sp. MCCC 1A17872]|uniref:hypothetical protein n=1 Tax=Celerinatantimonas sp. MCCC 1A17872 TaxID=3177514 RepID=UPI0038C923EE
MWRVLFNLSLHIFSEREPESWRISAVTLITGVFTIATFFLLFFVLVLFPNLGKLFLAYPLVLFIPLFIFFSWFFFYGVKQFKLFVNESKAEDDSRGGSL